MTAADDGPTEAPEIEQLARIEQRACGIREATRRALKLARRYRAEEGVAGGARERACLLQVQRWRQMLRELHALPVRSAFAGGIGPGLARTELRSETVTQRKRA